MTTKFLVISDIHGNERCLNKIRASYHKYEPDFSVVCGDITHFGPPQDAMNILERIPTDVIGIIGNCDPESVIQAYAEAEEEYIELKITQKGDLDFIGLSGSSYSEDKLQTFERRGSVSDVFVFHQPPYDILDKTSKGEHIGNKDLKPMIEKLEPKLVLSGHVHEDRGIVEEENTTFMNPGPAMDDKLGLVEIEDDTIDAKLI